MITGPCDVYERALECRSAAVCPPLPQVVQPKRDKAVLSVNAYYGEFIANYRLSWCTRLPENQSSRRTLPLPEMAVIALARTADLSWGSPEGLLFSSRHGTALNDTNLLRRHLKPAARLIGVPWVSWHTLRRTHATLLPLAGGSAKDAQAQLGHSQITTTLDLYTIPIPARQRAAVEKLSHLVMNGDEFRAKRESPITEAQVLQ